MTNKKRAKRLLNWLDPEEPQTCKWWKWYEGEVESITKALDEAEKRGKESAAILCESAELLMEIVPGETKKAYGIRIINALMGEIRESNK